MQTFTQECEAVKKGATTFGRMTFNLSKQNGSQRIDYGTYPKNTQQNMMSVVYIEYSNYGKGRF
jgi:hypothetical protein